ncbi:hypothetical protein [Citreimonas salinaria]|uniref:Uncharacterized protein n=1 Tax=Citreimonas salinaria TaxID=321339 RepID=A0A1H3NYB6_9RHOB|nr:hypothetical protein [Citreimonas salinaria]SDY93886.1 hypothetical protein SAMN05444340_1382 [Citreimonas salinaria]
MSVETQVALVGIGISGLTVIAVKVMVWFDEHEKRASANGGVKAGHAAAQNQASGRAPSAMARALAA